MKCTLLLSLFTVFVLVSCQEQESKTFENTNTHALLDEYKTALLDLNTNRIERKKFLSQLTPNIQKLTDEGMQKLMREYPSGFDSKEEFENMKKQYLTDEQIQYLKNRKKYFIADTIDKISELESKLLGLGMSKQELSEIEWQIVKENYLR